MSTNDSSMDLDAADVAAASLATPDLSTAEWLRTLPAQVVSLHAVKIGGVVHELKVPLVRPAPSVVTNSGKGGSDRPAGSEVGAIGAGAPYLSSPGGRRKSLPPKGVVPPPQRPWEAELGPFALSHAKDTGKEGGGRKGEAPDCEGFDTTGASPRRSGGDDNAGAMEEEEEEAGEKLGADAEEASKESGGNNGGAPVGNDRDDEVLEVADALATLNRKGKSNGEGEDTGSAGGAEVVGPGSSVGDGGSDAKGSTITIRGKVLDIENIPAHVEPILRDPAHNCNQKAMYRGVTPRGKRWESKIAFNGATVGLGTYDTEIEAAKMYAWAYSLWRGEEAMETARLEGEKAVAAHEEAVAEQQNAPPPEVGGAVTFLGKVLDVKKIPAHAKPILRDPATNRSQKIIHRGVTPRGKRWEPKIAFKGATVGLGTYDTDLQAASVYAWAYSLLHGVEAMETARHKGEEAVAAHKEAVEAKQNAPPPEIGDVPVPRISPRAWARRSDEEKKNLAWECGYGGDVERFENEALELEVVEPPSVEKKRNTKPSKLGRRRASTPAGARIVSEDSVTAHILANEGEIDTGVWADVSYKNGSVNGYDVGGMYYLWRDGFFNQGKSDDDMGARAFAHHAFSNGKEGTMINTVPTMSSGYLKTRLAEAEAMMKFYGFLLDKLIHGENFWCDSKEDVEKWMAYVQVFDKTGKLDIKLGEGKFISIDTSSGKQYWKLHEKYDEWWPIAYPGAGRNAEERKQKNEAFTRMNFKEKVEHCKQKCGDRWTATGTDRWTGVEYDFITETIQKRDNDALTPDELNVLAEVGFLEMSYSDRQKKNALEAFEMHCPILRRYQAMDGKGKGAFPRRDRPRAKSKDRANPKWVDSTAAYLADRLSLFRGTSKQKGRRQLTTEMRAVLVDEFGLEAFKDQPEEPEENEEPDENETSEVGDNRRKRKKPEQAVPAPDELESEEAGRLLAKLNGGKVRVTVNVGGAAIDGTDEEDESVNDDPDEFYIECSKCKGWDFIHKHCAGFGVAEAKEKDWMCWRCTNFDLRYDLLSLPLM